MSDEKERQEFIQELENILNDLGFKEDFEQDLKLKDKGYRKIIHNRLDLYIYFVDTKISDGQIDINLINLPSTSMVIKASYKLEKSIFILKKNLDLCYLVKSNVLQLIIQGNLDFLIQKLLYECYIENKG